MGEGDKRGCDTLLLGVTGSVGVLAMPQYVGLLRRAFAPNVHVIMSRSAQRFVTPYAFEMFTDHRVFCDTFEQGDGIKVPHLELTRRADLFLIAPATANILAKCAAGLADDLLSTAVLACPAPVVFAPSMNEVMWQSRVVQRNVRSLRALGHRVLSPAKGIEILDLEPTFGAMPPFVDLLRALNDVLVQARRPEARRPEARRPAARRPGARRRA